MTTNKWKEIPGSCTRRIDMLKTTILHSVINKFKQFLFIKTVFLREQKQTQKQRNFEFL